MGAEVRLRECYAEGGVGGEVELGVAFSPVLDYGDIDRSGRAGSEDF